MFALHVSPSFMMTWGYNRGNYVRAGDEYMIAYNIK